MSDASDERSEEPADTQGLEAAAQGAPRAHWLHALFLVAIGAATAIGYSNALDGQFVLDDLGNIPQNPHIRMEELSLSALGEAAFQSRDVRRPLANATLALNYWWGGLDPRGYHLFNIVVHALNGALVYALGLITFGLLARREGADFWPRDSAAIPWMAATAGLLFVVHPIQTQAVTYVIQRMASLSTLFYLIALYAYLRGRARAGGDGVGWFAGAAIAWLLALGCKQTALTLPLALVLFELTLLQRDPLAWSKRWVLVFLGVGLVLALVAWLAFSTGSVFDYSMRSFTMGERLLTQARVSMRYLGLILFPHPTLLCLRHGIEPSSSFVVPITTAFSFAALAALAALGWLCRRRQPLVAFCVAWFFLQLALESSFLPLVLMFEHRLYLPMVGIAWLFAYLLFSAVPNSRVFTAVAVGVTIVTLGLWTHERNEVWRTRESVWSDAVSKYPNDSLSHFDLGVALLEQENYSKAAAHFMEAWKIAPGYGSAGLNLGVALGKMGEIEDAVTVLERTVAIAPGNPNARHSLGTAYKLLGRPDLAVVQYREAVRLAPDHQAAVADLARAEAALQAEDAGSAP